MWVRHFIEDKLKLRATKKLDQGHMVRKAKWDLDFQIPTEILSFNPPVHLPQAHTHKGGMVINLQTFSQGLKLCFLVQLLF